MATTKIAAVNRIKAKTLKFFEVLLIEFTNFLLLFNGQIVNKLFQALFCLLLEENRLNLLLKSVLNMAYFFRDLNKIFRLKVGSNIQNIIHRFHRLTVYFLLKIKAPIILINNQEKTP